MKNILKAIINLIGLVIIICCIICSESVYGLFFTAFMGSAVMVLLNEELFKE